MKTRFARSLDVAHAPNFVRPFAHPSDTNYSTNPQQPITDGHFCYPSFPLVARRCCLLHLRNAKIGNDLAEDR